MTEQEIQQKAEELYQDRMSDDYCFGSYHGFLQGAKWMQEQDEWISVETPPKEGGRYLAVVKELNDLGYCTYVWNCCYHEVENRWSDNLKNMTVTHWQNLPQPPKTK